VHNQRKVVPKNNQMDTTKMTEEIIFPCDICKEDIIITTNSPKVKVISKQVTADDFFGTLETYHIESQCRPNEIHVNIVVIDGQKRYRGHKYSAIKSLESIDKNLGSNLQLLLTFGKELAKPLAAILKGDSIILAGSAPSQNSGRRP